MFEFYSAPLVSCSQWQPQPGGFSDSWHSLKGWAMPPTLFSISIIISIENLLVTILSAMGHSNPLSSVPCG